MPEPQERINGVRQQGCSVPDADETELIAVVQTDLTYAKLYAVTRAGAARYIGRTAEGACGKVDSAWPRYFQDGTARLYAAGADVGGSGSTSHTVFFDFPNEVHPIPPTATAVDQAARDQANYATKVATTAQSNAAAAVNQSNAATNMAHSALDANAAQDEQIDALDTRVSAIEAV